jgi:CII-binding regulator of phage lambda lysogenization HflD
MTLIWVQMFGVLATALASGFTFVNAHSANRSQTDVAHRTSSLTEMEKALTFTGSQLENIRLRVTELERLHEECERDKFELRMELAQLRGHW